jgi:alkaline phosphatase
MRRLVYRNFRVILGGGKKQFGIPVDPGSDDSCNRTDGRNLLDTWIPNKGRLFVNNTEELMNADSSKVRNVSALQEHVDTSQNELPVH